MVSLRARIGFLILGSVLPLALVGLAATWFLYRTSQEGSATRLVSLARTLVGATESRLASVTGAAEALALSPTLVTGDFQSFRSLAEGYLDRHVPGSTAVLTSPDGAQLMNTGLPRGAPPPRTTATAQIRQITEAILRDGRPRISGVFVGQVVKEPRISIHVPVFDGGGAVHYVLGISVPLTKVSEVLAHADLPRDWTVAVFDATGATVTRYPLRDIGEPASPSLRPALQQKRDQVLDTITHEGVLVSTAVSFSRVTGWSVALGVPKADMQTPFRLALLGILGVGAASVILGLWAAWRLARRVLEADRQRDLLVNELNHRVKNSLASLQAIANQTMRSASTKEEGAKSLEGRIMAMARTHDLLTAANWESAALIDIVRQATVPFVRPDALTIEGPEANLAPQTALSLAMILNELATNAAKYGALSTAGTLRITWEASHDDILLHWEEVGGPVVVEPKRRGFGTRFIERAAQVKSQMHFRPEGLQCMLIFKAQPA